MNKIGISVLKMESRESHHPYCFASLIDNNCDFIIRSINPNNFTMSRHSGLTQLVEMGYVYIGWVDDDDEMIPHIFTKLLQVFKDYPDTSIAFSEQYISYREQTRHHKLGEPETIHIAEHISDMHQPVLIRSDIYNKYSYTIQDNTHTERSLYREIQVKEPTLKIRCLCIPGYIYKKRDK